MVSMDPRPTQWTSPSDYRWELKWPSPDTSSGWGPAWGVGGSPACRPPSITTPRTCRASAVTVTRKWWEDWSGYSPSTTRTQTTMDRTENGKPQHSTVQYSIGQYSTVQYSTVQPPSPSDTSCDCLTHVYVFYFHFLYNFYYWIAKYCCWNLLEKSEALLSLGVVWVVGKNTLVLQERRAMPWSPSDITLVLSYVMVFSV